MGIVADETPVPYHRITEAQVVFRLALAFILMVLVAVVFYPLSRPVQPAEAPKVVDTIIVRVIRESFHNQNLRSLRRH